MGVGCPGPAVRCELQFHDAIAAVAGMRGANRRS